MLSSYKLIVKILMIMNTNSKFPPAMHALDFGPVNMYIYAMILSGTVYMKAYVWGVGIGCLKVKLLHVGIQPFQMAMMQSRE